MTIILFIVSLAVLCIMVGSKIFEIKVRKIAFLSDAFTKGDEKIHQLIAKGISKYNLYKKIVNLFIFDFLPSLVYEVLVKMKDYVSKKYYSYGAAEGFRGRRVLRSNGSVSFFLERLSEDGSDATNKI